MDHSPASTSVITAYGQAEKGYIARNPESEELFLKATESLPGGNTRTVLFYHPFPVSIVRAEGARLYDADGHVYIDLLGEYTAGLYGHSEPTIINAITETAKRGLSYGSHHGDEGKLASLIKERFPSIDLLRFTNSGTEATLMALAAAKVYTGKNKILVFEGGYHGGAFSFKHGSSPVNAPHEYLIAEYNDIGSVRAVLGDPSVANDLAAIVIEPMMGSGGAFLGEEAFLLALRDIANETAAVLIFDEVMTSRLYSGGGIQSQLPADMRPDMTTLGKYIGGGMSFGAFGGKREIMSLFDPRREGHLAHAGTFNNNVLTMAAGRAGLENVFTAKRAEQLHARGEALLQRLQKLGEGTTMKVSGCGSIMCFHFTATPAEKMKQPPPDEDHPLGDLLHLFLMEKGYYIARRGFVALSLALTDADLDGFVTTVEEFLEQQRPLVMLN